MNPHKFQIRQDQLVLPSNSQLLSSIRICKYISTLLEKQTCFFKYSKD